MKKDFKLLKSETLVAIVGVVWFEHTTSCSQSRRDNQATLHPELHLIFIEKNLKGAQKYILN